MGALTRFFVEKGQHMIRKLLLSSSVFVLCAVFGLFGGRSEAEKAIRKPGSRVDDPEQYRKECAVYGLKGGILMGMFLGTIVIILLPTSPNKNVGISTRRDIEKED